MLPLRDGKEMAEQESTLARDQQPAWPCHKPAEELSNTGASHMAINRSYYITQIDHIYI